MAATIVLTRPAAQAQALAQRLREASREVVLLPLLEIAPLEDDSALRQALAHPEQYSLIAFVSPNAIDAACRVRPNWPPGLHFAVVGEASRRALLAHGIDPHASRITAPTDTQRSDSETLLLELDVTALNGKRVLILRGETGRELLADALRAAGAVVEPVAAYSRRNSPLDSRTSAALAKLISVECRWVITSSEALRNLVQWGRLLDASHESTTVAPGHLQHLLASPILVPHPRIAETARELGFNHIDQCGSGDDNLFAKLQLLQ